MLKYEAVLFDLDGVITDTAHYHYIAWRKLANSLGGDISLEFNENLKGVDRTESLKRILKEINVKVGEDEFKELLIKKNDDYVNSLDDLTREDILPGVEDFMNDLKTNNLKIIIASASKNAPMIINKLGLDYLVDDIANPSDVAKNKPAPDIFLLAASLAGVTIDKAIGVEDAQAGIDALNSANINSIAIGSYLNNATIKLEDTSLLNIDLLK